MITKKQKGKYFISFDGTKIFYAISDKVNQSKGTIIFLHGLGGNLRAWDKQATYFQNKGYQTIAFDLRGHGLSGRPKNIEDYALEKLARDIAKFLEIYPQKDVILVGHCLGGMVVIKITEILKTIPKAIILISTSIDPLRSHRFLYKYSKILHLVAKLPLKSPIPIGQIKQVSFEKFSGTTDLNPQRIISDIFYTTLQSYVATSSQVTAINSKNSLASISCPSLIIHGANDVIFPISAAYRLHREIKGSRLVILPKANHIIPINNPEELTHHIETYLNSVYKLKRTMHTKKHEASRIKMSVVIPVFNEESYITACLTHLFDQEELPDEVIVVDNNSTDKTVELAGKFSVRIIKESMQGITPARNCGFNSAKYPIIGRIDADTLVPPNWVRDIKDRFETDSHLIAFSGGTVFENKRLDVLLKLPGMAYYTSFKKILGCDCLYGPNMAIRKQAWKKVKSSICLDDHLVHEDADLAVHLAEMNIGNIVFDPNFLVKVSNRRWGNINSSYLEYPYRYLKMILHHKESLKILDQGHQAIENALSKAKKTIESI